VANGFPPKLGYFYPDIIHPGRINRKQDNLTMIQIPVDLAKLYTSFMEQKGVETDQHLYYIKRKQAHHAVSFFYEMGHLSGRKTIVREPPVRTRILGGVGRGGEKLKCTRLDPS